MYFRLKDVPSCRFDSREGAVGKTVVDPGAAPLAGYEMRFTQNPKMMRYGGLIQGKFGREIANADLFARPSQRCKHV